jgi:hypothetical protein
MQYTLRNIPRNLDRALRSKAKAEGKSLNQAALEAIQRGLGLEHEKRVVRDLDWFLGTAELEPEVLRALAEQDVVNPDDWK